MTVDKASDIRGVGPLADIESLAAEQLQNVSVVNGQVKAAESQKS